MQSFLTDDQLDNMIDNRQPSTAMVPAPQAPPPIPLYPLHLAATGESAAEPLFKRNIAGAPVWAWGLIALGVGSGAYFFTRSRKSGESKEGETAKPKVGDMVSLAANKVVGSSSSSGWAPSRSGFASKIQHYFDRKGQTGNVKVWVDADEAKDSGMKFVSPLVNVQVMGGAVKVDQALTRFCRREGLNPVQHSDGSIGLYPHQGKRGKEWEGYIDALRDDGQKV